MIISLGGNDVKARFAAATETIAAGAERLIDVALASAAGSGGAAPEAVLVAPPPIAQLSEYAEMFEGGAEKALRCEFRFIPATYSDK